MNHTVRPDATAAPARAGDTPARRSLQTALAGSVLRFFGWWFGMAGLASMFVTCPCCGQQACGNAVVGMGFVGAVSASMMRVRRWFSRNPSCASGTASAATAVTQDEIRTPGHASP